MWDAAKGSNEKLIAPNACIKNNESSQISDLSLCNKKIKEEESKFKEN